MTATLYPGRSIRRSAGSALPNYALRRGLALVALVVVVSVLALAMLTLVNVVGVVVDFGGRPAAASEVEPSGTHPAAPVVRIHVAEPGDTLWSIADAYRGDVGRDGFIEALIDLNGGTGIQIGQAVHLP